MPRAAAEQIHQFRLRRVATVIRHVLAMLAMTTPALAQEPGLALWEKIHAVFAHPRCVNCHVGPDNVPLWSGPEYGGRPRPHGMNINGGISRKGAEYIPCGACHTWHNAQLPHGPPGAPPAYPGADWWALAPLEMQWVGRSSAEICAQVKDPARNRGRTIAQGERSLAMHIATEPLVQWGWAPGPDRTTPPYSAAEVVEFLKQWDAAGAPCPMN
jgi:hypothetical protein